MAVQVVMEASHPWIETELTLSPTYYTQWLQVSIIYNINTLIVDTVISHHFDQTL